MAQFESHDYDPVDNDVERERDINRSHRDYQVEEFWKWFICVLIGVTMGIVAFLVDLGIELLNEWKFGRVKSAIELSHSFFPPYITYLVFTVLYASVAGGLVSFVEPLAAGSGIPELKTYLNGIHIKGLLAMKTMIAKLVGIMFSISAGLIAGKEGPFVHGGGIVGGGLGAMGSQTLSKLLGGAPVRMPRAAGGYFHTDAAHRDFTAIGTAAGVATAFAAPIGGLLFTIEEGASFYSTSIFWRGFMATCIGVLTLHMLVEARNNANGLEGARFGVHRDFGLYNDVIAGYGSKFYYYLWDIPIFIAMGCIGGVMGGLFIHVNVFITRLRHRFIPIRTPAKRLAEVIFMAVLTATVFFCITYNSPCKALPPARTLEILNAGDSGASEASGETADEEFYSHGGDVDHFPQLWCKEGEYNQLGQLFFVPLAQALRLIVHLGEPLPAVEYSEYEFDISVLLSFFLVCYVLMVWTYGVGAATGLFVPSLAVGAAFGRLTGRLVKAVVSNIQPDLHVSLSSYAVIGAAASLGGATRMTLSITVLVMETTGSLQLIVPVMLTVLFSKLVGDQFGFGIYDTHIKIRGAPLLDEFQLEPHQKMVADKLAAHELMSSAIVAFTPVVPLRTVVEALTSCSHSGFPITNNPVLSFSTNDPFELQGIVLRTTLLKMIQQRIGFFRRCDGVPDMSGWIPKTQRERHDLLTRLEQRPLKVRPKTDQEAILASLSAEDLEGLAIDLRPFMQRHPYCVHADAPLSRVYRLMRTMGLRHVFVAPPRPMVVGMLTRKDVISENAQLALGEKASRHGAAIDAADADARHGLPFLPYSPYDASAAPIAGVAGKLGDGLQDADGGVAGSTLSLAAQAPRRRGAAMPREVEMGGTIMDGSPHSTGGIMQLIDGSDRVLPSDSALHNAAAKIPDKV